MSKKVKTKTAPGVPLQSLQRYTIPEALAYLRTSRATIYCLIAAGDLRVIREGKRTYVPGSEIARLSAVPQ